MRRWHNPGPYRVEKAAQMPNKANSPQALLGSEARPPRTTDALRESMDAGAYSLAILRNALLPELITSQVQETMRGNWWR